MIHFDTSVLIDALTGPKRSGPRLRQLILDGERIFLSSLVLFEWRRGPRTPQEIADLWTLYPGDFKDIPDLKLLPSESSIKARS